MKADKIEETWKPLLAHYQQIQKSHLKNLLNNKERNDQLVLQFSDFILDFTHEKMNQETL